MGLRVDTESITGTTVANDFEVFCVKRFVMIHPGFQDIDGVRDCRDVIAFPAQVTFDHLERAGHVHVVLYAHENRAGIGR